MKTQRTQKSISLLVVLATILSCLAFPVSASSDSFPAIGEKNYIETKAEVGMPVFLNEALTIRGTKAPWRWYNAWIDAGDTVRIIGICNNKAVILQYPTASGWRTGYACFANFFNYSPSEKIVATANATVRAVPYGAAYGTITSGDTVYRAGESNGHVLVIYQAKSGNRGYKLGYILESDYNRIKNHVSQTTLSNALYKINVPNSKITCGFDGYTPGKTNGRHEGIDFAYGIGKNIYSLTDGVITNIVEGKNGSKGLSTIAIYNQSTDNTIIYLHANPDDKLKVGDPIKKGELIGTESWRGISTANSAHTHVEVRSGSRTNAAKSLEDYVLSNSNPKSFWESMGYTVK